MGYKVSSTPEANIALVSALSDSDDDLTAAIAYSVENNLGKVISNSWGGAESQEDPASNALYDLVLSSATVQGISVNFSSGDSGDNIQSLGYEDISSPSSPFLTSIGGTSLVLSTDGSVKFQAGWGTNLTQISDVDANGTVVPLVAPAKTVFKYGAGGGMSRTYFKPAYQANLTGSGRQMPDIGFLADPFTGAQVVQSKFDANGNPQPGTTSTLVFGGTSLACPMFSAVWAIANQRAGHSLGFAAPALYRLPSSAISDIVPQGSPNNVVGDIFSGGRDVRYTALQLSAPETSVGFFSALFNNYKKPGQWNVATFGTDSTLFTAPGWDNVTGLGTPNGKAFVDALAR